MSTGLCAVCQKPSHLKCARCRSVDYCGKEHQKKHWSKHQKTDCLAYKVKTWCEDYPRVVIATRDIKEGEIILKETPLALGPQSDSCPGCFRSLPKNGIFIRCSRCKWPVCSRQCAGLADPALHGAECKVLSAIRSSFIVHSRKALLPLRCLLLQRNDPKKWQVVYELAWHADAMHQGRSSKGEGWFFLEDAIFKPLVAKAPHLLPPKCSTPLLGRIFSLVESCGVHMNSPHREGIIAILPVSSLMEHSCMPNTRMTFEVDDGDGSERRCQVIVRAAEDILKGEELTTIFLDVFKSTLSRQILLDEYRGDICYCARCMDATELGTNLGTFICEKCCGHVLPCDTDDILDGDWECTKCKKIFSIDDIIKKRDCFVDEFVSLRIKEKPILVAIEAMTAAFEKHLHPHNIHFLVNKIEIINMCKKRIVDDLIVDSELEKGAEYCRDVLSVCLTPILIDHSMVWIADVLLSLCHINLEIMKRKVARRQLDSAKVELVKKYCSELKLLSTRFSNADYKESDVKSLRSKGIRLSPF